MKTKIVVLATLINIFIFSLCSASFTDDLKTAYKDGDFYIEYVMTKQNAKGEILKNQITSMWKPGERFDKYIYAQKGGKKYYQRNDYAEAQQNRIHGGMRKEYLDNYYECIIMNIQAEPLFSSMLYDLEGDKVQSNDVNIVNGGKIYALDRTSNKGYWTTAEEIANNPKMMHIVCINMMIPTVINSILFNDSSKSMTRFVSAEPVFEMSEQLLCETYEYQRTNDYGSPIGERWFFKLYFKDGTLIYFSDAMSSSYIGRLKDKHIKFLNKVLTIRKVDDDALFERHKYFELKKYEAK